MPAPISALARALVASAQDGFPRRLYAPAAVTGSTVTVGNSADGFLESAACLEDEADRLRRRYPSGSFNREVEVLDRAAGAYLARALELA